MGLATLSAYVVSALKRAFRSNEAAAIVQAQLENKALCPAFEVVYKGADYTIDGVADNRKLLLATAACNFTLPAPAAGMAFTLGQTADANLVVTGTSKLVSINTLTGSTATFSTSSQKRGSRVTVEAVDIDGSGTWRWLVTNLGGTTMVIA